METVCENAEKLSLFINLERFKFGNLGNKKRVALRSSGWDDHGVRAHSSVYREPLRLALQLERS